MAQGRFELQADHSWGRRLEPAPSTPTFYQAISRTKCRNRLYQGVLQQGSAVGDHTRSEHTAIGKVDVKKASSMRGDLRVRLTLKI